MKIDRRYLLALIPGIAVLGGGALALFGLPGAKEIATQIPGVSQASAQDRDLTSLNEPPAIGERALGKPDAPVTMIEYASATCPHCAAFHNETFPTIKKDYIDTGKIRFVFREFPLDDLALAGAMVARCAPEEKYFPILEVLFEQQRTWTRGNPREELFKIAQLAGFSRESFDQCLKNEEVAKGILAIRGTADEKYRVDSTPTFFINGEAVEGNVPLEEFRKIIEKAAG
jgi:protein-disulfide isomerase